MLRETIYEMDTETHWTGSTQRPSVSTIEHVTKAGSRCTGLPMIMSHTTLCLLRVQMHLYNGDFLTNQNEWHHREISYYNRYLIYIRLHARTHAHTHTHLYYSTACVDVCVCVCMCVHVYMCVCVCCVCCVYVCVVYVFNFNRTSFFDI